ncbi:MAG: FAD-dependent oxidoreductase [Pseudomonadota bacterium]
MRDKADIIVIGAGVFGLWVALEGIRAGLSVVVLERDRPGAGASGGVVGALTPHMPGRWRPMKQFQLDSLMCLPEATEQLTRETGLPTGYMMSGRLSPLADASSRTRAETYAIAAQAEWEGRARFEILERPPKEVDGFLPATSCPHGVVRDGLSGRIVPRLYIDALVAAVEAGGEIRTGWEVRAIDGESGLVTSAQGQLTADTVVVAAGWQSPGLAGVANGGGVKGQAAILAADMPESSPVIQMPRLYLVRHPGGRVAIGSTSETDWDGMATDTQLDDVIGRARSVCPALLSAEVIERWAGVRPRPAGRDPTVGWVPGQPRLYLASGGYKIGLGIAHLVGRGAIAQITDQRARYPIPADFAPVPEPA